jgi:hypothetical protein
MEVSGEKGEASESKQPRSESSLEELLNSLIPKGGDIGGIFIPREEVDSLKEGTKWMVVMRVLTTRPFSVISMKKPCASPGRRSSRLALGMLRRIGL